MRKGFQANGLERMSEPSKKRRLFLVLFCAGAAMLLFLQSGAAFTPPAQGDSSPPTFKAGERLGFNLYWGFIKVGETVMEELPNTIAQGQTARHFRLKIRTSALIDLIYKVRSEFEAFTDLGINRSLLYRKNQFEDGTQKAVTVKFDWENHKARYMDSGTYGQETEILPGAFDPLGILYYLRTVNFARTDRIEAPVTDGKKCIASSVSLLGTERLQFEGKSHETYVLQSDMKDIEGLFEKSRDSRFTLWLSTDHTRMPLMINIDLFFDTVVCKLVSTTAGQSHFRLSPPTAGTKIQLKYKSF